MIDILQRILDLRLERGWTEHGFAQRAGIPQSTISSWYRNGQIPSTPTIEKICDTFDITMSQFFAVPGDNVMELKPEQLELLNQTSCFNEEQLKALISFIDSIKKTTRLN